MKKHNEHIGPLKILIMDDEENIRDLAKEVLLKSGYFVELAIDGEEAIEKVKQALESNSPFGLIIMDITIPSGMGGKEASKIIFEMDKDAKIIVSSGDLADPLMADYKAYGLSGILPKPYRIGELKSIVEQHF